jgi:hypothetical protein
MARGTLVLLSSLGVRAWDRVETDGVKTCSEIDHRPLSGFGHWSFVGH